MRRQTGPSTRLPSTRTAQVVPGPYLDHWFRCGRISSHDNLCHHLACKPVRTGWDITVADPKCIDRPAVYQVAAILGAITDTMVLAIPIPVVIRLKISWRQKVGLLCFFCIGGV